MSRKISDLNIEPCPDCPIPTNFIVKALPASPADNGCTKFSVDCRECGDKWTEVLDEQ